MPLEDGKFLLAGHGRTPDRFGHRLKLPAQRAARLGVSLQASAHAVLVFVLMLVRRANAVAFSDYEGALIEAKTGLDARALSRLGPTVFCTHGARGSTVWADGTGIDVTAPALIAADPVGAGDAYRGGLLWGMTHGLTDVESARLGTLMGRAKVAVAGPTYRVTADALRRDYETFWGPAPY